MIPLNSLPLMLTSQAPAPKHPRRFLGYWVGFMPESWSIVLLLNSWMLEREKRQWPVPKKALTCTLSERLA
jgi:hypothetical protein